ncbi:galactokinase [Rosettibacter firmus]|uniref:galactokinase n=1 Tax=Rosettibacter firmus TaxID=3111522 RepID=UPI00336C303B
MRIFDDVLVEKKHSEKILSLKSEFEKVFENSNGTVFAITPVSLMLLGDHTHYNDGILLSVALNKYTILILRKRKDNYVKIVNAENNNKIEFTLSDIPEVKEIDFKYHVGLIKILKKNNLINSGFECIYYSEVPDCIGIGKYSSMETGFIMALKKSFRLKIEAEKLFELIHQNELNLIGKISNPTHYYTVMFSKKNKLFFHDLRKKEFNTIPVKKNFEIVIVDTHEKILNPLNICNERIEECEVGVKGLRLYIWGIKNLRDVGLEFLLKHYHMIPRRIFNRVLYNVKERERVEKAINSIKNNSLTEFGKFIFESHWSMAEDYELSNDNLNYIISKSAENDCVIGSKMISCTSIRSSYHIVRKECSEKFIDYIKNVYREKFNKEVTTYTLEFSDGVLLFSQKKLETII